MANILLKSYFTKALVEVSDIRHRSSGNFIVPVVFIRSVVLVLGITALDFPMLFLN